MEKKMGRRNVAEAGGKKPRGKWTVTSIRKVRAKIEREAVSKTTWKAFDSLNEWMALYRYDKAHLRTSLVKRNQLQGWLELPSEEFVDEVLRIALMHQNSFLVTQELCDTLSPLPAKRGSSKDSPGESVEPGLESSQVNLVDEIVRVALLHKDSWDITNDLMHMSSQLLREYTGKAEVRTAVTLPLSELKALVKKISFLLPRNINASPRACVRVMTGGVYLTTAVEKRNIAANIPVMQVQAHTDSISAKGIFSTPISFDMSKEFCRKLKTLRGSDVTIEFFDYLAKMLIDRAIVYVTPLTKGVALLGIDYMRETKTFIMAPRNELVKIFRNLRERFPYVWINMYAGENYTRKAVRFQASNRETGDRVDKRFEGIEWEREDRRKDDVAGALRGS
jgi:hypothetical protein